MNAIVRGIVREIECLDGAELRTVIDALVEIFERRQAERLSRVNGKTDKIDSGVVEA